MYSYVEATIKYFSSSYGSVYCHTSDITVVGSNSLRSRNIIISMHKVEICRILKYAEGKIAQGRNKHNVELYEVDIHPKGHTSPTPLCGLI